MFKIIWVNNYQRAWWLTSNNLAVFRVVQHDWIFLQELSSLDLEKRKENRDLSKVWKAITKEYGTDSVYGRFAIVLFANFWSRFAYVLMGQFPNCFCLIGGWKNEVYTCLSRFFGSWLRERSIYMRSARFASQRNDRDVGETTSRRNDRSPPIVLGGGGFWFPNILPILKFSSHSEKRKP